MATRYKQQPKSSQTHTTALVLMVLFTALVLVFALGDTELTGQSPSANNPATTSPTAPGGEELPARDDLLAGIPVDEDAVVKNQLVTRGGTEAMEQTITFETDRSGPALAREYQTWLDDNQYTTADQRVGTRAASLAATRGNNALIVLISHLTVSDTSRVEIINYQR